VYVESTVEAIVVALLDTFSATVKDTFFRLTPRCARVSDLVKWFWERLNATRGFKVQVVCLLGLTLLAASRLSAIILVWQARRFLAAIMGGRAIQIEFNSDGDCFMLKSEI
jgi:hypothetical protein